MIKVAYLSHSMEIGGAEVSLYHLIRNMDRSRYKVYLICPVESRMVNFYSDLNIEIIQYNLDESIIKVKTSEVKLSSILNIVLKGIKIYQAIRELRKIIKEYQIDIIHSNSMKAHFFSPFLRSGKSKVIWHVRDLISSKFINKLLKVLSIKVDNIIAISQFVSDHLDLKDKTKIVYNCVNLQQYNGELKNLKEELEIKEDEQLIVTVGQITKRKGFHYLLEAFRDITLKNQNVTLAIVGHHLFDGPEYYNSLVKFVNDNNLNDKVRFLGFRKDVPANLRSADIFIFPSINEPFGRVIIEAMAAHTPIIASNSGGIPEIIKNDLTGILVSNGDIQGLTTAMERLINDEEFCKSLTSKADKELYKYTPENHTQEIEKIYDKLVR